MTSITQASFSASLSRGKKLYQYITIFPGYWGQTEELNLKAFKAVLDIMEATQFQYAETYLSFTEVAIERKKLFISAPLSISKRITLMNSYIQDKFHKDSQIYADVSAIVKKIRAEKFVKISRYANSETLSLAEKLYETQTESFGDLVAFIVKLGASYAPTNNSIKLEKLKEIYIKMININNIASYKLAALKPNIAKRLDNFEELNYMANKIKDMVKREYGIESKEYKLLRSLSFWHL